MMVKNFFQMQNLALSNLISHLTQPTWGDWKHALETMLSGSGVGKSERERRRGADWIRILFTPGIQGVRRSDRDKGRVMREAAAAN